MTTKDFIKQAIGKKVYITGDKDLGIHSELRPLILNKTELTFIKLTKKGKAYVKNEETIEYFSVPQANIREIEELWQ